VQLGDSGEKGSGGEEIRVRLKDVSTGRLSGLNYKLVCHLKLGADIIKGGIREFVYDANEPAFLGRESIGFDVDRYW
jgi:hypothetical protein